MQNQECCIFLAVINNISVNIADICNACHNTCTVGITQSSLYAVFIKVSGRDRVVFSESRTHCFLEAVHIGYPFLTNKALLYIPRSAFALFYIIISPISLPVNKHYVNKIILSLLDSISMINIVSV